MHRQLLHNSWIIFAKSPTRDAAFPKTLRKQEKEASRWSHATFLNIDFMLDGACNISLMIAAEHGNKKKETSRPDRARFRKRTLRFVSSRYNEYDNCLSFLVIYVLCKFVNVSFEIHDCIPVFSQWLCIELDSCCKLPNYWNEHNFSRFITLDSNSINIYF